MQTETELELMNHELHADTCCSVCAAKIQEAVDNSQKVLNGAQKIYEKFANNPMLSRLLGGNS